MESISPVVSYFVNQGVPLKTVDLLLMLPVVVTMIAFFRQVVGIKAFGIYTPAIVIFSFLDIGIKYGIALFITVIVVGMISRNIVKRLRILYLPRVAINLSIVSFAVLILLVASGSFKRTGLAAVSIIPLVIMISLVEKFIAAQIEKGDRTALFLASETLLISIVGFYLANWSYLIGLIEKYPWAVLLSIPVNILLGKWTGLRLIEYFRFREVLKKIQ